MIIHMETKFKTLLKLSLLCSVAALINCTPESKLNSSIIDFEQITIKHQIQNMGNRIKSIEFIPLESSQNNPLSDISKIIYHQDKFYIHADDNIQVYSRDGKYIDSFGSLGRGPNEHNSILDFTIDKKNDKLILYDFIDNKLKIFNFNAELIYSITVEPILEISSDNNGSIVSYPLNLLGNNPKKLFVTNLMGSLLNTSQNYITFSLKGEPFIIPVKGVFYTYDNTLHFKQMFSDTIFYLNHSTNNLIPKYTIQNINTFPLDLLGDRLKYIKNRNNYSWITRVQETKEMLLFDYFNKGINERAIYLKSEGTLVKINSSKSSDKIFEKSAIFWPNEYDEKIGIIKHWSAIDFKDFFKNIDKYDDSNLFLERIQNKNFKEIYKSIKDEDNHIIQIIKFN